MSAARKFRRHTGRPPLWAAGSKPRLEDVRALLPDEQAKVIAMLDSMPPMPTEDSPLDEVFTLIDRHWFRDHPGCKVYIRPVIDGEFPEWATAEMPEGCRAVVRVTQHNVGVRSRKLLFVQERSSAE